MSPKERAEVLAVPGNRSLVESFGTNLLLLSGKDTPLDKLQVGLIYRNHPQTNTPDGIGPLGGIAEIIAWEDFVSLSPNEQNNLIGLKDNVIAGKDGNAVFLTDKNLIRINNIAREVKEELTDIGIIPPSLDFAKMELADLPGIKDDSYIINVWNGQKPAADVFAINPQGAKLYIEEALLDDLVKQAKPPKNHGEVRDFLKMPFTEALRRYGKTGGDFQDKDGFDLTYNFRYPHEYLVLWQEAAKRLNFNQDAIKSLIQEINPDFNLLAEKLAKPLSFIEEIIGLKKQ